jgi:anti-anti-sigma factor
VSGPLAQLGFEAIGDVLVGRVEGEIESANADDLRAAIAGRLTNAGAGLVLDLSETTYLDSAGIELLFDLARRLRTHRQGLALVVPDGSPMRRVLDLCDIERVAPVDGTLEAALEGLRQPAA